MHPSGGIGVDLPGEAADPFEVGVPVDVHAVEAGGEEGIPVGIGQKIPLIPLFEGEETVPFRQPEGEIPAPPAPSVVSPIRRGIGEDFFHPGLHFGEGLGLPRPVGDGFLPEFVHEGLCLHREVRLALVNTYGVDAEGHVLGGPLGLHDEAHRLPVVDGSPLGHGFQLAGGAAEKEVLPLGDFGDGQGDAGADPGQDPHLHAAGPSIRRLEEPGEHGGSGPEAGDVHPEPAAFSERVNVERAVVHFGRESSLPLRKGENEGAARREDLTDSHALRVQIAYGKGIEINHRSYSFSLFRRKICGSRSGGLCHSPVRLRSR